MTVLPLRQRLAAKMLLTPSGCVEWTGTLHKRLGYGMAYDGGRRHLAHRLVWRAFVGEIPEGLVLDHLCRNSRCVSPMHLEPVTQAENIMRGESPFAVRARQTHCVRGHLLDPARARGRGTRACRECHRLRVAAARRGEKLAAPDVFLAEASR